MPRMTNEELQKKLDDGIAAWNELKAKLIAEDHLDEDGYPTEAALELIAKWHWADCKGLLEFIKGIWYMADWGWREVDSKNLDPNSRDYDTGALLVVSTAGWSGNESLIRAFQDNTMAWHLCWIQSRRGGHYIFKPHEFEDDE